ncbi:hypothetical protein F7725_019978, partial [Dissostichus mawsoni]
MSNSHPLRPLASVSEIDHIHLLSEQLGALVLGEEYSDVTFIVEGKRFPAHRVILAARCHYFRQAEVCLEETRTEAFSMLLHYLYTGRASLSSAREEVLLDFLGLAHRYGLQPLEDSTSEFLRTILHINNVCPVFDVASLYSLSALNAAWRLHGPTRARKKEIFLALSRWCRQHEEGVDTQEVMAAVRLPLMTLTEMLNTVRPSGLLSPDDLLDAIKTRSESRNMDLNYRGMLTTMKYGAQVVKGELKSALLDGDTQNYDLDHGFSRHPIEDDCRAGIQVKLGQSSYSYYIEVSMDELDWVRVVDHSKFLCRSWQNLFFTPRVCSVIEGVSRSRNALLNGDTRNYDWDSGYTCHQLGSGAIRSYSYYIEVSATQQQWTKVVDRTRAACRSWQTLKFDKQPASFIRIVGTHNTANEVFHCVHFESPAQLDTDVNEGSPGLDASDPDSASPQTRPQRPSRTHSLHPTIRTWAYRRESVERTGEKTSPQNAIFAQPSSPRLHCYSDAKGDRLIVITHDPSVISATLETGVSVAAAAFRAPVFPVLKQK